MPGTKIATLIVPDLPATSDTTKTDLDLAKSHLAKGEFDQAMTVGARLIRRHPNDPIGHDVQGLAYLGKKDLVNARKSFDHALEIRPDDVPSQLVLAQLDVQQKDLASARKRYQTLLAKDAKNLPAMLGMAEVEAATGNSKESVAWLEKAKGANPEAVAPRVALGTYHLRRNENSAALAELEEAQRLHPADPQVLSLLGEAQAANGQKAESVATYKKLVAVQPASAVAHYRLALAQIGNHQSFSDATESLKKAIQLKPDYVDAIVALARVEVRAGRRDQAMKLAKDLQKVAPKSAAGLALEGDLLVAEKRHGDAAKAYQKALAVQQTGLLAAKLHAAEVKAGNAKEADAKLQKWLKDHPDNVTALEYSAGLNLKDGKNKLAIEQFQRVLQKAPRNTIALNSLAILYQRENDPRAIATAEEAYKTTPDSPMTADTLGWILVEQGKTAEGLKLIRKAALRAPENPEIRYHLAVALAKTGDNAGSRQELKTLLAEHKKFPQREAAEALLKKL